MSEINMIRGVKSSVFVEQMVLVPVDEANFYVALLLFNILRVKLVDWFLMPLFLHIYLLLRQIIGAAVKLK